MTPPPLKKSTIGFAAFYLSLLAVGFTVIPGFVMDRPLPSLLDEQAKAAKKESETEENSKEGITLEFKGVSVNFGGEKKPTPTTSEKDETQAEEDPKQQEKRKQAKLFKIFRIVSFSCALIAIAGAVISWVKEEQRYLPSITTGLCAWRLPGSTSCLASRSPQVSSS